MSFKKFLFSRSLLTNLIVAFIVIIILITITFIKIRKYTNHGQAYAVPNLIGLTENEVQDIIKAEKLNYQIIDSAFISLNNPGSVIDQVPKPGFKVKQNRTILLTINASAPEDVAVPQLRDISYRQALALIENTGLKLGNVSYKPSEYNDLVLYVLSDSSEVNQGDFLPKGARIDLVIGRVSGFEKTPLPDLTGLSLGNAKQVISTAILNLGVIIYDESVITVEDSINARIWKQQPNQRVVSIVEPGSSIDIWVTVDNAKIDEAIKN